MSQSAVKASGVTDAPDAGRWKALVFIALAQLMVVLDSTIVNIALPSAQRGAASAPSSPAWPASPRPPRSAARPPTRR